LKTTSPTLDLAAVGRLDFTPPDEVRFPALRVAREALAAGSWAPPVMNAANEVAVAAFLAGRIGFLDIVETVERTLDASAPAKPDSIEAIIALDQAARRLATEKIAALGRDQ